MKRPMSSDRPIGRPGPRAAFTLLEIVMSLAIVGLLLVGMNTFIFSMGELWGRNSDVRLFDQHVNAVTRFIAQQLQKATLPPAARPLAVPINPEQITPLNGPPDSLLTFDLPNGCRILNWPDRPLPEVVCSLQVRPHEGLFLLWHSRLEMTFDTSPPRETALTPLVTALSYDYYDDNQKRWTTLTALQSDATGLPVAPQRLRLTFTYGKFVRQTTVAIPLALQGLPNF
jgi:prepilin-type N-terminal cleavage/methylation domain-containing protein